MKNRKKSWALMGVVAACGLALAACDGGGTTMAATDPDQISGEGPVVAPTPVPAPSPAVPQELTDRLTALEEEIAAKAATTADKDADVAALEAKIKDLQKDLKDEKKAAKKAVNELKRKLEEAQREARRARQAQEDAEDEAAELEDGIRLADRGPMTSATNQENQSASSNAGKTSVDDELLAGARITVGFDEINDVDDSPNENGQLTEEDQWLCVLLFKNERKKKVNKDDYCVDHCFNNTKRDWVAAADARACYHVEECSDESNSGDEWNDIGQCSRERALVVKDRMTKTGDITHAYLLAHDTGGDDFDFRISGITIHTNRAVARFAPTRGEVPHQFLLMNLGDVVWTEGE